MSLLQAVARVSKPTIDLIRDGQVALASLASHPYVFRPRSTTRNSFAITRRLLGKRRADIAEYCGFPRDSVKILRRLRPEDCSLVNLLKLRKTLNSSDRRLCKFLHHLPKNTSLPRHMMIALSYPEFLTPSFMIEISEHSGRRLPPLDDIRRMRDALGLQPPVGGFKSIRQARVSHRELVDRLNIQTYNNRMERYMYDWPPSPIPDGEVLVDDSIVKIVALTTFADLCEHAKRAKNCSRSYAPEVSTGRVFIFELFRDVQEAPIHTASIRAHQGVWRLAEIERAVNRSAEPVVREAFLRHLFQEQRHTLKSPAEFVRGETNGIDALEDWDLDEGELI